MYMEDNIRIFYGIPTVVERWEYATELSTQIGIGKENIFLDKKKKGCLWNKMRIYDYAFVNGYTHACINDDDCIVCEGYKKIVEKCIKRFPNAVLTFFSNDFAAPKLLPSPFVRRLNCELAGAGCVLPIKYFEEYKKFYNCHLAKYKFNWEDTTTKMFCLMNDIPVYLIVPNIVDVRENLITVARKGNWTTKQSLSFSFVFDETLLESPSIYISRSKKLFNLHLPKGCDTESMILKKWEEIKNENSL